MSEREHEFVVVGSSAIRCPFCHESIVVESSAWVVCESCLARHHEACWSESKRCSSCAGSSVLERPKSSTPAAIPQAEGDARAATSRLFREGASARGSILPAALATATGGMTSFVGAELAFRRHCRANAATLAPHAETESARERAARPSRVGLVARVVLGTVSAVALVASLAFLYQWLTLEPPPPPPPPPPPASLLDALFPRIDLSGADFSLGLGYALSKFFLFWGAIVAQATAGLAFTTLLHAFRASVRRHERAQLEAELVADATPPERAIEILDRTKRDWTSRLAADAALTLASLVPFAGLVVLPIAAARLRGTLSLHEEHERALLRKRWWGGPPCPPSPRKAGRDACPTATSSDDR